MASDSNGTYPEMVIEVDQMAQWQRTGAPPSPLGTKVSATLRDVLAWRARAEDTKGFAAALDRAFTPTIENGYTKWLWTPRSYAVQADLGEVTGAQASLYSRAKAGIDHAIPLLESVPSLNPAADQDDADRVRVLIISELRELVAELGAVGGPRIPRVDGLFEMLIGKNAQNPRALADKTLLGLLATELGLHKEHVNTIDDEQNLTNYYIVVDHVIALHRSWETFRENFGDDPFFGTQLILLSRALASIVEAVYQITFVMDSVFLSAADRQLLRVQNGAYSLSVSELLGWIERFAAEEAPRIMREAGKRGVSAFEMTLSTLRDYTVAAQNVTSVYLVVDGQTQKPAPDAFRLPRVLNSLNELELYLGEALALTQKVETTQEPLVERSLPPARTNEPLTFQARADADNPIVGADLVRRPPQQKP